MTNIEFAGGLAVHVEPFILYGKEPREGDWDDSALVQPKKKNHYCYYFLPLPGAGTGSFCLTDLHPSRITLALYSWLFCATSSSCLSKGRYTWQFIQISRKKSSVEALPMSSGGVMWCDNSRSRLWPLTTRFIAKTARGF